MAWTQADVDALKDAMKSGIRDVTYSDGSRATYRSLDDMRSLLAEMQAEVAGSAVERVRSVRVSTTKGF